MKVVILCGGKGLRMSGLKDNVPKALAEVNGKPLLWNLMQLYSHYGHNEFILPLGYKGDQIKEYFMNYLWKSSDVKIDLSNNSYELLGESKDWKVTCVDTGIDTMTGARIKKIEKFIENDDTFLLTYGDGLSDININELIKFHHQKGKLVTVTGVKRHSQYGELHSENGLAIGFREKPQLDSIINGGFFVCNKKFFNYVSNSEDCVLEEEPLRNLIRDKELSVYEHNGTWVSIDTPKDLSEANKIDWETICS